MDDNILFREMELNDRDKIVDFYRGLGEESARFFNLNGGNERRSLDFFENNRPGHRFFVAEENGVIVGHLFIWDTDRMIPWLGIGVRDECQGKHVGTFMLESVFSLLKAEGFGGLLLRTAKENIAAQRLYEKRGFEKLGDHPSGELLYIKRFTIGE